MPENFKSLTLTAIQYSLAVWLLLLNPWFSGNYLLIAIQLLGILIGIYAIYEMRKSKFNATPLPRKGAILITSGPYRYVRHPMYLALILYFYPVAIPLEDTLTYVVLGVFTANLIIKMMYEESLLQQQFKRYDVYSKNTSRLIPRIF